MLSIKNINIDITGKSIVKNLTLVMQSGQIHAIMGPNGSGKSSLALSIMGHPRYQLKSGSITFVDQEITNLSPDKRAQLGLFLSMQQPCEIPGVGVFSFLREAHRALTGIDSVHADFKQEILHAMDMLGIPSAFFDRNLNEGFSGGEKKRFEILQLLLFKPRLAILDEIDSGLDVDALKKIAQALLHYKKTNPQASLLLITHYQRILEYIIPDVVHVMVAGIVKQSGDHTLAQSVERQGYHAFR